MKKKAVAVVLTMALSVGGMSGALGAPLAQAAKKMQLSKKKITMQAGKTYRLKIKNQKAKTKVKWSSSRAGVASVKKGLVKAKKSGKAIITAKITNKSGKKVLRKLKCSVIVKKAKNADTADTAASQTTPPVPVATPPGTDQIEIIPTAPSATNQIQIIPPAPSATDQVQIIPTMTPSAQPTGSVSPTPLVTQNPDADVTAAVAWPGNDFYVSDITFEDSSIRYMAAGDRIFVEPEEGKTVKDLIPDPNKCTYYVYAGEQMYTNVEVDQVIWQEEPFYSAYGADSGYYMLRLYIHDGRQSYYRDFYIVSKVFVQKTPAAAVTIQSIKTDNDTVLLERAEADPDHYYVDLAGKRDVRQRIPDPEKAEIQAYYLNKPLENAKIIAVRWNNRGWSSDDGGYYKLRLSGTCGSQYIETMIQVTEYTDDFTVLSAAKTNGGQIVWSNQKGTAASVLNVTAEEGKTLRDMYPNLAEEISFEGLYRNKIVPLTVSRVRWSDEPYNSSGCDGGYYTFDLSCQVDGKTVKGQFFMTEPYVYRQEAGGEAACKISGKLTDGNGNAIPKQLFTLKNDNRTYYFYTKKDGTYEGTVPQGTYEAYCNGVKADVNIVVSEKEVTADIMMSELHEVSGTLYRMNRSWKKRQIRFRNTTGSYYTNYYTKSGGEKGKYQIFLPSGTYAVNVGAAKVAELTVNDTAVTYDIYDERVQMTGKVYLHDKVKPQSKEFSLYMYRTDKPSTKLSMPIDASGNYEVYADKNAEYKICVSGYTKPLEVMTIRTGETDQKQDITAGVYEVSGKILNMDGRPLYAEVSITAVSGAEVSTEGTSNSGNGCYTWYLPNGTYKIKDRMSLEEKSITVDGGDQTECDITFSYYTVSGTFYNFSKADAKGRWLKLSGTNVGGVSGNTAGLWVYEDGTYSATLPKGTYTVSLYGYEYLGTISTFTISDKNVTHDMHVTLYEISGSLCYEESKKIADTAEPVKLILCDAAGKEVLKKRTAPDYTWIVQEPGTYTVKYFDTVLDTITVTEEKTIKDITLNSYLLTGTISTVSVDDGKLKFVSTSDSAVMYKTKRYYFWSGSSNYAIYLPAGTYDVYLAKKKVGTVTMTGENQEKDFMYQ